MVPEVMVLDFTQNFSNQKETEVCTALQEKISRWKSYI